MMPEVADHFEIPHQSGADECQRPTGCECCGLLQEMVLTGCPMDPACPLDYDPVYL